MSTIDRAFVKAFQKNRRTLDASDASETHDEARAAALGMSTIWIDANSEQCWRSDSAHGQPQPLAAQRLRGTGRPATDGRPSSQNMLSAENAIAESGGAPSLRQSVTSEPASDGIAAGDRGPELCGPGQAGDGTFDLHMFDAIDVAPSPLAAFTQCAQPREEAPPASPTKRTSPPLSVELPPPRSEDQDRPPSSVPFVKIHQRPEVGNDPGASVASPHLPNAAREEATIATGDPVATEEAAAFEAAWEVDSLETLPVVTKLLEEDGLVAEAVAPLVDACRGGLRTLLVSSSAPQQGRTTIAFGLAMAAARAGLHVALLDVDTERPGLADQLGLEVESDWTETVRHGIPLQESAIYSVRDRLTLLPIVVGASAANPRREEIVKTLTTLQAAFDLVVLDGIAFTVDAAAKSVLPASRIDSALVVRDRRDRDEAGFEECVAALTQMGIEHIGVADNFVGVGS